MSLIAPRSKRFDRGALESISVGFSANSFAIHRVTYVAFHSVKLHHSFALQMNAISRSEMPRIGQRRKCSNNTFRLRTTTISIPIVVLEFALEAKWACAPTLTIENRIWKCSKDFMILVIDNYDSFVHNLARYFRQLGCETVVVRNDKTGVSQVEKLNPQAIVLSPGPCTPDESGCCLDLVRAFKSTIPMLGICLGHQAIVQAFGGKLVLANEPIHGRPSDVFHTGSPMFHEVPSPFVAGRYHSLIAKKIDLPAEFQITARTDDGTIMAVEHRDRPLVGLQFHPESILTECGHQLLINFLTLSGIKFDGSRSMPTWAGEVARPVVTTDPTRSSRLSMQTDSHTEGSP